jgi:midasin
MLAFWAFFREAAGPAAAGVQLGVRDLLAWARFVRAAAPRIGTFPAYAHGAHLVLLDGIGLGAGVPSEVPCPSSAQGLGPLAVHLVSAPGAL